MSLVIVVAWGALFCLNKNVPRHVSWGGDREGRQKSVNSVVSCFCPDSGVWFESPVAWHGDKGDTSDRTVEHKRAQNDWVLGNSIVGMVFCFGNTMPKFNSLNCPENSTFTTFWFNFPGKIPSLLQTLFAFLVDWHCVRIQSALTTLSEIVFFSSALKYQSISAAQQLWVCVRNPYTNVTLFYVAGSRRKWIYDAIIVPIMLDVLVFAAIQRFTCVCRVKTAIFFALDMFWNPRK